MKLTKTLVALLALAATSGSVFAAPAQKMITKDEATQLVLQIMPRGSEHLSTSYDKDDGRWVYEVDGFMK